MRDESKMDISPSRKYCPCFCEENVWHLVQESEFKNSERMVAFISNTEKTCLFWNQRAGHQEDLPVIWDYHVILFVKNGDWLVYDLDTNLPTPTSADTYLRQTFRGSDRLPDAFAPHFLLFSGDAYVETFSSDRSHMLDEQGKWLASPPEWPAIEQEGGGRFLEFVQRQLRSADPLTMNEALTRFA